MNRHDLICTLRCKISELTGRVVSSEDHGAMSTRFTVAGEEALASRVIIVGWEHLEVLIDRPDVLAAGLPAAFFQEMPYGCKL